jgi:hypothetical protein
LYPYIIHPLSIYQYPWQILILGLLMGMIALTPLLIAQLLSFLYSVPCLLMVAILARMPLLAGFLLVSCVAVACRPLRFRSRFISIALCMAPQLGYWIWFAGGEQDPIRWGVSFAPWFCAWLTVLIVTAGRCRRSLQPVLRAWTRRPSSGVTFGVVNVGYRVGLSTLYRRQQPEDPHSRTMTSRRSLIGSSPIRRRAVFSGVHPTDPLFAQDPVREIQIQLGYDRWPNWFDAPGTQYQEKRQQLLRHYDSL